MRTDEQREKLRKKQKYARKMSKACLQLAEEQPMRGGHMTWEWPRRNKAWKYKEVQRFFYNLERQGKVFEACLDGCQVGVIAPGNGLPMIEETMDNHVNRSTCGPLFGFEMRRRAPTH